jgi:hypothetical protein
MPDQSFYGGMFDSPAASTAPVQANPWVDLATQGWLTGNPSAPTPDDQYYNQTVPELRDAASQSGGNSWLQQFWNALGVVGPHLRDLGPGPVYHGPAAPAPHVAMRGTGQRWQSPQPTRLADWTEGRHGLYPRFYSLGMGTSGYNYAGGGAVERPAEQYPAAESPHLFRGPGGGQGDELDAKVSPGEYIFSAGDVAMLGDGDNEEGARRLDEMRGALRKHLTSRGEGHPPKAKPPLQYLRGAS